MNQTKNLSNPVSPTNIMYTAKTIIKGRFIIEDYSDCVVKDYKKFVIKLKACDSKNQICESTCKSQIDNNKLIKLIEIQQKQINLIKKALGHNKSIDIFFNNSNEMIKQLLKELKK